MTLALMTPSKWQEVAQIVLTLAKKKGATQAEVSIGTQQGFNVTVRLGETETLEHYHDKSLTVGVYFGQQLGVSSTTDISLHALENTVNAACSIAKATGSDACHGLADKSLMATQYPDLDLFHPWQITVNEAIDIAKNCEKAGRDYSDCIINSEGASVSQQEGFALYANSHDFMGLNFFSHHTISCALLAQSAQSAQSDEKQSDYDYTTARDPKELLSPELIGQQAAQKTVAKLNARKLTTRTSPVIFSPRVAQGFLQHFLTAIQGARLYQQSSFLCDSLGTQLFPEFIDIDENPHILKALGSAAFDAEGVKTQAKNFIQQGILQHYVLNSYSARKLGMQTTGNAGGVHNLQIRQTNNYHYADNNLTALLKKMHTGLLVTSVLGQGVNIVTGDYSRGATGFWVENGEIQYPVHEITIAGHLKDLFLNIQAIGNDIDKRGNIWSGSLLLDHMIIAGD